MNQIFYQISAIRIFGNSKTCLILEIHSDIKFDLITAMNFIINKMLHKSHDMQAFLSIIFTELQNLSIVTVENIFHLIVIQTAITNIPFHIF